MKRFAISALLFSTAAVACLNDRDTLAFEVRNVDALNRITKETDHRKKATAVQELALRAIAGRFERYPDRYYQMRIDRLEAKPSRTSAEQDDLAVAYDRLGNVRQAIKLILESKANRVSKDDWYRFHANYGTFLVHRWIADGHKESDAKTLRESIGQIEKALAINPNSHFGRERVQLALQKSWLPGLDSEKEYAIWDGLQQQDILVGLSGIVMMGLGYELPDVYELMADTHVPGQAGVSILPGLASMRVRDLGSRGIKPIVEPQYTSDPPTDEQSRDYRRIRDDGEAVHKARLAYMNARFDRGEHPDTHSAFWSEWREPPYPVLQREGGSQNPATWIIALTLIAGAALLTAIVVFVVRRLKSRPKAPALS